jgi:DNA modification methylase
MNKLILGDNLEILKSLESETIDLIYLDPPFFSNRNYEVIWGDAGEIRSFQDRWSGGIEHYIAWLKERVEQMHRILKSTGSIFLHCDWHANAEIKVFVLNKIFDEQNFRGEIIWQRTNAHNDAKKKLAVLTDSIFYYTKSDKFTYHAIYGKHTEDYKESFYKHDDNDGRGVYRLDNMASPNPRPNMMYEWMGYLYPTKGWRYDKKAMQKLHDEGRIYYPKDKNGEPDYTKRLCLKRYLNEQMGTLLGNIWIDIPNVQAHAKERIGYPTQKPEALIDRIIKMASHENDTILDPFVGGGTTITVADRLKRNWIGIDQSVQAIKISELRLQKQQDLFSPPFIVQLHKYDYDTLRYQDAFQFESFMIQQLGGIANSKQRSDLGLDGKTLDNIPIQVKRSDNIGRNVIDNFQSACKRFDPDAFESRRNELKKIGILIAFSFGKGAIEEVARLRNKENIMIELLKVEDIIPIAKKPKLTVSFISQSKNDKGVHTIQLIAKAESDNEIEFYAWDFDYNANGGFKAAIMIDKEGKQVYKFKTGSHNIAVKAIDNAGLESLEVITLKINGVTEKVI